MQVWRIALLLLAVQLPPLPQSQRTGSASVEGIVVRLGTNEPISGVDLELTDTSPQQSPAPSAGTAPAASPPTAQSPAPTPFAAKTGSDGRFVFRNLPPGAFKLVAARIGGVYVPVEYGQRGILGRGIVFPLGDGEQKKDIRLEMAPVGTITGRVFDENNKPVGHAAVMALSPMYREDQQILNIAQLVHTDDRGEYRLFSLVPGRYFVAVRPEDPGRRTVPLNIVPPGRRGPYEQAVSPVVTKRILPTGEIEEETYGFVYFGGTTDVRRAVPLNLGPGGNVGAVDIPIAVGKSKAFHIRGKVLDGVTGNAAAGAAVRLIPRAFSSFMIVPTTTTNAAGEFDLSGVTPGSYQIYFLGAQVPQRATPGVPPPPPPPPLMAMMPMEVGNENVNGVTVTIALGSTTEGRVAIEGRPENDPDLARIRVVLEAVPSGVAMVSSFNGPVTANGTFSIPNLWPADYRIQAQGLPANSYVKSIQLGALDLLTGTLRVPVQASGSIEIVIGADTGLIEGRVVNDRQDPSTNVTVALVPDGPLRRRGDLYKSTATDLSGGFRLPGVAPGDYRLFAWEEVGDGAWRDPEFIRLDESRGKAVRISSGRTESTTLTVIPAKR